MAGCSTCPFGGLKVGTRGPEDAPLVIIGESPGTQEVKAGKPFIGPSGNLLHKVLPRDTPAYITNALCCKPPKNKTPAKMQKAIMACRERLLAEIRKHPRKVILTLGGPAIQAVTGNLNIKITQMRGQVIDSDLAEYGIVLAVHPAFLMRGGGDYQQFKADINKALELLNTGTLQRKWQEPILVNNAADVFGTAIIQNPTYIAADIETSGFNPLTDRILSVGFSNIKEPDKVYITDDLEEIKQLIETPYFRFVWHNGKFDTSFLRAVNIRAKVDEDTMLLSYALNEKGGMHDLEQKMVDLLRAPSYKDALKIYLPNRKASYELVPKDVLWEYQAKDVCGTGMIFPIMKEQVDADADLHKLYRKVLLPASEMLTNVEARGLYVDKERVAENEVVFAEELEQRKKELYDLSGWEINPNSPQQVAKLLYDQFRQRGKGRSTAKEVVRDMQHPAAAMVLEYRKVSKALSTYVRGAISKADPDNRVRTTYLLHGATTGRLASRNPNLQNIPRDPRLRGMFIASPGFVFLEADYSQAELRSLAILSADEFLCDVYNTTDRSLHKEVAKTMYGEDYDRDQYIRAKAVNFGIVYGRGAPSIAKEFHISVQEAQRIINAWFARAPLAYKFILKCRATPLKGQTITTVFGRKRRFGVVSRDNIRELQNEAANFPHQSIASDCTLLSAVDLDPVLIVKDVRIVNLIHDSILTECPNDSEHIAFAKEQMSNIMVKKPTEWGLDRVPFKVDFKIGPRWGSMKEMK